MSSRRTPEDLARDAQRALFAKEPDGRYEVALTAKADGSAKARVQIYGVIGDWWDGLDAATLANKITALETDEIEVHLNSPGGIAFDGIAIHNALKQHDADVHVMVDGLAASAASIIAMAGDKITMAVGSQLMVHDASGLCWGQASDMAKTAEILDKLSDSIADVYASRAAGTRDEWRQIMLAETWYTAAEAVEAGLADQVDQALEDGQAKNATSAFDLTIFAYAGRDQAPAPHMPPARPEEPTTQKEGVAMSDTLSKGLRERLGVKAEALDEAGLLAALDEALAEQTATIEPVPPGTVLIDQAVLAGLQADAAQGRAAREQQLTDQRESLVQAALADGRIAPASAQDWRDSLAEAPAQASKLLASLAKNTVPVLASGYTGGVEESNDNDEAGLYARLYPGETKEA